MSTDDGTLTLAVTGEIANSASGGKCGYPTRSELAHAYASLLTRRLHVGQTVNLHGELITQAQLVRFLNGAFGTNLAHREMSSVDFVVDRTAQLGAFLRPIIDGIYDGIRLGAYDNPSDFQAVAGRAHQSWDDYFRSLRT